jgi:GT2 family glycosyltransferase
LTVPDVSVVVPNYQGRSVLPETLTALRRALGSAPFRSETIVVDDASSDGSPDLVARDHPEVRLLREPSNRGFGATCNRGASEAKAPLLFLLNSDVSVHEGFLAPLVETLRAGDLFAAAPLQLDEEGRVRGPSQVAPEIRRGQIRLKSLDLDPLRRAGRLTALAPIRTLFGSGGALLLRRDRFEALGGFADAFAPFYYEDTDLGWRAWRRGWPTVVEPGSVVTHRSGGAIASTQQKRRVRTIRKRNRFLLVWRNLVDPRDFRRRHLMRLPAHLAGSLLRGDGSVVRGFAAALRMRQGLAEHRAREREAAVKEDREIFAELEAERRRLEGA